MKSTEATVFDGKSGGAEGPAVRPGSLTKVWDKTGQTEIWAQDDDRRIIQQD